MSSRKRSKPKKVKKPNRLLKSFFEGLLVLLPLSLTIYIFYIIFRFIYRTLSFIPDFIVEQIPSIQTWGLAGEIIFTIVALILALFVIVLFGAIGKTFIGRAFGRFIERIINNLPGIKGVYNAFKKLLGFIFGDHEQNYSAVVLIQYPHPGVWSIAFVTSETSPELKPDDNEDYYTVFMPSTPNPTTGFVMIIPKKDVILTDISIDTAFKTLISGGILKEEDEDAEEDVRG